MLREMLGFNEGILRDLQNDHDEVEELLSEIMDSRDGDERVRLFDEMKSRLLPHLQAEQEVLYQRLETGKSEEAREFGVEGASEHEIIERQVAKMTRLRDPASDEWTAELKVLQDLIEHHVDEEETTGFSCAREEFDKQELQAMAEKFQIRKVRLGMRVE
jgi:hemerythrin-like domain-containing protein